MNYLTLCYFTLREADSARGNVELCSKPARFAVVPADHRHHKIECDGMPYLPVCAEHYDRLVAEGWLDATQAFLLDEHP